MADEEDGYFYTTKNKKVVFVPEKEFPDGAGGTHKPTPAETERLKAHGIGRKTIILPKKEYAEFCSAIRTKFADKIPRNGQILYGKYYYRFRYNKRQERIVCTFKLEIVGNEDMINYYWEKFENEQV